MATTMMMVLSFILISVITLVAGIYLYFKYVVYTYWSKRNVIHEEPIIPVGCMGTVLTGKKNPGEIYQDLYNKYKKHRYFGSYAFFVPNLTIADPDLIKLVLTKEFNHFQDRNFFNNEEVDPLSGHLFASKGQKWKNLRSKLSPTFTTGKMKMMFHILRSGSEELDKYLTERQGQDVDIKEIFARFTTDTIMSTAFGVKCNSLRNPDCEFRYWGKKVLEPKLIWNLMFVFVPKILDTLRLPYYGKDCTRFFVNAFEETFKLRMKEKTKSKRDFLDLLVQLINDGYVEDDEGNKPSLSDSSEGKLTILESVAQAFVYFLAGYETSSSTATFCLYELSMNMEMQDKVRDEVHEIVAKHGGITYESLNEMSYLTKVVLETLRKYPTLMYLNRLCTKDIVLPTTDLHIEKGLDILIPVLGLHLDPEYFPDPLKFDPERFSDENANKRHQFVYLPFGEGPRNCIGMRFGMMQAKVAVASCLMNNRVTLSPTTVQPLKLDPGSFVYTTVNAINLHLSPL